MDTTGYDVAIVGGGAAGLSTALVLGRARRSVVVIDDGKPRNKPAAHMQGFISRDGMAPAELLEAGRVEVRDYSVDIVADEVVKARSGGPVVVQLASGGLISARRLVLASGAVDRLPDIAGARERWGRDFLHCPYCHGWEVRDQPIGVLGTDPASVDHAQLLRQWSDDIIFFSHTQEIAAEEHAAMRVRGIAVVEGLVSRFSVADDRIQAVQLEDGSVIPRSAVFMRPTLCPRGEALIASLGCELDPSGFIQVDSVGKTTVPGVWAVGNAANPRAQVITAAGEGSAAAIAINGDLVEEDIAMALSRPRST